MEGTNRGEVLRTERLTLRRLTLDDAGFIVGLLNQPSFLQFIGDRGVRNEDDARTYLLNGPLSSYTRLGFGLFLVTLTEGGTPIGMCGLLKRDSLDHVDLGFAFLPEHWGRGYAVEAASGILALGLTTWKLPRIVAIANTDNHGSIRVLEKIGMSFERVMTMPGESREVRLYGLQAGASTI
jgi:RimJ/RimL family protein N-acetyltransferase